MEEAAAKEFVQNGAILAVESLGGKELHHFFHNFNAGVEDLSPTLRLFITQIGLEPLLRDRAQALGAEHRFGTELVSFEQDADGVTSVIRDRDSGPSRSSTPTTSSAPTARTARSATSWASRCWAAATSPTA